MRIKKDLKKTGYFWLPSNPDKKVPGTLFISDGGEIELEIVGLFGEIEEELDLSLKAYTCLKRAGVDTFGDL